MSPHRPNASREEDGFRHILGSVRYQPRSEMMSVVIMPMVVMDQGTMKIRLHPIFELDRCRYQRRHVRRKPAPEGARDLLFSG